MNIGWLEPSITPTRVLSPSGQPSGVPSGVADQSCARMRAPISPPPERKSGAAGSIPLGRLSCMERIRQGLQLALHAPLALVEEPQGRPNDLAGAAVAAGRDLAVD